MIKSQLNEMNIIKKFEKKNNRECTCGGARLGSGVNPASHQAWATLGQSNH